MTLILLAPASAEDHVEFSLLFSGFSRSSSTASGSNGHRCSGGNAPLFFKHLGQLSSFQDGQVGKVFHDFGEISHFLTSLYSVRTGFELFHSEVPPYAASSFRAYAPMTRATAPAGALTIWAMRVAGV
jgi:hypothetical protein